MMNQNVPFYQTTPFSFEFSLYLSRACLGKIMHFIYKWRNKWRFLTCGSGEVIVARNVFPNGIRMVE